MTNLVTVIDFSSSGLRLVTGYYFKGTVYALQALEGDPITLDENGNLDKKETLQSLAILLQECKNRLQNDLGVYIALLPPSGFMVNSQSAETVTSDEDYYITQTDYNKCINQINKLAKVEGKKIIYDHPSLFADDNKKDYDYFPSGSNSETLKVFADAHMIDEKVYEHYKSILNELHLDIFMYLVAPFATISFINSFGGPKSYICLDVEKDYTYLSYVSKHRMNDSTRIPFGIDQAISEASKILNLDEDKTFEYLKTFGLLKDPGFLFITPENKNLEEISSALKKGFSTLIELVDNFIKKHEIDPTDPIILSGVGSDIEQFDKFILHELKRSNMVFYSKVIGARNKVFTNCVGAILISSFSYQTPLNDAKKLDGNQAFKDEGFSRGK